MATAASVRCVAALQPPRCQQPLRSAVRSAQDLRPCFAAAPAAAAAARRAARRPLHVVAVRVENEEVALGTKAPDFEVRSFIAYFSWAGTPADCWQQP